MISKKKFFSHWIKRKFRLNNILGKRVAKKYFKLILVVHYFLKDEYKKLN